MFVPEDDDALGRLIDLLKRHEDLDLLAKLLEADDPHAVLSALGHGTATSDQGDAEDDGGGWFSDDDGDLLDHDDLDRFGERLGYAAGGMVCLVALLASWFQGITVYKDVDSWILTVEVANGEAVLAASAATALVLGGCVGFLYRAFTDDAYDGYRSDLAAAVFDVPLFGSISFVALYLFSPVVLNAVNGLLVDALTYLVALVVLLFVAAIPIVVGPSVGVGVVVAVPAFAGIFGGSLFGALVRPDRRT